MSVCWIPHPAWTRLIWWILLGYNAEWPTLSWIVTSWQLGRLWLHISTLKQIIGHLLILRSSFCNCVIFFRIYGFPRLLIVTLFITILFKVPYHYNPFPFMISYLPDRSMILYLTQVSFLPPILSFRGLWKHIQL